MRKGLGGGEATGEGGRSLTSDRRLDDGKDAQKDIAGGHLLVVVCGELILRDLGDGKKMVALMWGMRMIVLFSSG